MKEYNKRNIPFAKELRKNMIPWERKLWYDFLRGYPVRFQRQKVIGEYIVDFYCARASLVIELDGGGHFDDKQAEYDRMRTAHMVKFNLTVVRIANNEINDNFYEVCQMIDTVVKQRISQLGR